MPFTDNPRRSFAGPFTGPGSPLGHLTGLLVRPYAEQAVRGRSASRDQAPHDDDAAARPARMPTDEGRR